MTYNENSPYRNKGALSALLNKEGVCQDYSELFVALCRASGIPARTVCGYRGDGSDSDTSDLTGASHMWAEFYLPDYGWVLAEPTEDLKLSDGTVPDYYLEEFFGKDLIPAEHITTGYENDLYKDSIVVQSSHDSRTAKPTMNLDFNVMLYVIDDKTPNNTVKMATTAVTIAETYKIQSDVDSAKTLVNALPDGTDKTNLSSRLNLVQTAISGDNAVQTATQAVIKAENSKTQVDVDSARTLVNALPDGTDKTNLSSRLDAVQKFIDDANNALQTATASVTKAESSKVQTDVDSARALVNSLPDGTDKTNLSSRLDAVQKSIDDSMQEEYRKIVNATALVSTASENPTRDNYNKALAAVNDLKDGVGKNKINLQAKLATILKIIESNEASDALQTATATAAVVKAESSKVQTDVDSARTLVNSLPDGTDKTNLSSRLDAVQKSIDDSMQEEYRKIVNATALVSTASENPTRDNYNNALAAVNDLKDGVGKNKTNLQAKLVTILKTIESNESKLQIAQSDVDIATTNATLDNYNKAMQSVSSLSDLTPEKESLLEKLDNVLETIINENQNDGKVTEIKNALDSIKRAELQTSTDSYNSAINVVQTLNDPEFKEISSRFNDRLSIVATKIKDKKARSKFQDLLNYPFLAAKNTMKSWKITFNQKMDSSTVNTNNISMKDSKGNLIKINVSCNDNVVTIIPVDKFQTGEQYVVYISEKVTNINGQGIKTGYYFTFEIN